MFVAFFLIFKVLNFFVALNGKFVNIDEVI